MILTRIRIQYERTALAELITLEFDSRFSGDWYLVRFLSDNFTGYVPGENLWHSAGMLHCAIAESR